MRRVAPTPTLLQRLVPRIAMGLAFIALSGGMTVACLKYLPPPRALVPMRDELLHDLMQLTAASGLRLENLTVEGRDHTTPEDLRAALDVGRGTPILAIDVAEARTALEALPWVKAARVERQLPDTVHVVIQEREPFALWQRGSKYYLVDRDGTPIVPVPEADPSLRMIVGPDAPAHASVLFAEIDKVPELGNRVRTAVRVGARRWNLYFDSFASGIAVRLPENDIGQAWQRLAQLERDHQILERDLEFIDLRLPDRLIVRLKRAEEPTKKPEKNALTGAPAPTTHQTNDKRSI
jgi:cell division protein FtsQ